MGFLDFLRPKREEEEGIYRTLLLKRLIEDTDELKRKVGFLENQIFMQKNKSQQEKETRPNKTEEQTKQHEKQKLTDKEQQIYSFFSKNNPKNIKDMSEKVGIKTPSLRAYISRIQKKGFTMEFKKEK